MQPRNLQFGKKLLNDFYLDPSYINVNHGSYGSCPKQVMQVKRTFEEQMDFNTEKWYWCQLYRFRVDAEVQLDEVRGVVANFVNAPKENVFMVENASDGFNGFMKSIKWKEGDVVAMPNTSYAMVKRTMDYLVDKYKIKILSIDFTQQDYRSSEAILLRIEDTINQFKGTVRMAICDHIGSVPAIIFPIEEIITFYHEKGIAVFIDGAHAVCQTNIDIRKLDPDGYVSNFHKWAYAPKQAAMLYISPRFMDQIHPTITGNFYGQGLPRQFFWTGTRDFSSYCAVPAGLNYYKSFGEGAVRQYNHNLTMQAGKLMASIWKTKLFTDDERLIGYLNNVEVPSTDINRCVQIATHMMNFYNCYPVVYEFEGKVFCRISAQIYNDISDYQFAAETFLDLLRSGMK